MRTHPDAIYPSPIPDRIREILLPGTKAVAYEFGKATEQMGLLVTDELMEVVGLCLLGAASAAAYAVLRDRNGMLADAAVCNWADTPNQ